MLMMDTLEFLRPEFDQLKIGTGVICICKRKKNYVLTKNRV